MINEITMINVNFEKNFVLCGDKEGYLMIQSILGNRILLKKTRIFYNDYKLISSAISNQFLCFANNNYQITTIHAKTFTINNKLTFNTKVRQSHLLKIHTINKNSYVFAIGNQI